MTTYLHIFLQNTTYNINTNCHQLATDLFPQACYRLTKPTDLSRLVDNLPQAGKINSFRQACEISGCVGKRSVKENTKTQKINNRST
jgi:hypothetical protein